MRCIDTPATEIIISATEVSHYCIIHCTWPFYTEAEHFSTGLNQIN
ncbi:hypothetical protein [Maridesulfovibrio sp.]